MLVNGALVMEDGKYTGAAPGKCYYGRHTRGGDNPLPEAKGWGERLVRHRTTLGMTQKEAARRLGVDQKTLARWEQGKREPQGAFLARVNRFLQDANASGARQAG